MREKRKATDKTVAEETGTEVADTGRSKHRRGDREKKNSPWWLDIIIGVVAAVAIMAVAKAFIFQFFVIPSESMENTLLEGDRIFVSKMKNFQEVRRGDIVVFEDRHGWLPDEFKHDDDSGFAGTSVGHAIDKGLRILQLKPEYAGGYLVKRIIGVGGDHVMCCNAQNQIEVNGQAIKEPYLKKGANNMLLPFDVTVPEGNYWVMGDNRDNSGDSRYHQDDENHGFVEEDQVVGRVILRYFPLNRWRQFPNPGLDKLEANPGSPTKIPREPAGTKPPASTEPPESGEPSAGTVLTTSAQSPPA